MIINIIEKKNKFHIDIGDTSENSIYIYIYIYRFCHISLIDFIERHIYHRDMKFRIDF